VTRATRGSGGGAWLKRGARCKWGTRRAGERSEERAAQVRRAMSGSEEQVSEQRRVGRAVGEDSSSEQSKTSPDGTDAHGKTYITV
jgi:hypothetical protein